MDDVVKKSCACTDTISDTTKLEQYYLELGACIFSAGAPYKKQIKKDYKIDLDDIVNDGKKFGELVGIKMASVCPKTLSRITQKAQKDKPSATTNEQTAKGIITQIDNDCFMTFSLKDEAGKITKFYWLTFVESKIELTSHYKSYIGESVIISYTIQEFFDPKINEYRQFYIINKIQ